MEYFSTKDLGSAVFLHANRIKIHEFKKVGNVVNFIFEDKESCEKIIDDYYNNGAVSGLAFWQSMKLLKTKIHQTVGEDSEEN
jgi:hypothetical protein